jgi:hypothetical protein
MLNDRQPGKVYLSIRNKGTRLTTGTIGPFNDAAEARVHYNSRIDRRQVLRATVQDAEGHDLFVLTQQ